MKTALCLIACVAICHAQFVPIFARYEGVWIEPGQTNRPISILLVGPSTAQLILPDIGSLNGTFKESATGAKTFYIETATNAWRGTINKGVVRGSYLHFTSGTKGTFQCDPPR